jgi:serine/threonine protein kinase
MRTLLDSYHSDKEGAARGSPLVKVTRDPVSLFTQLSKVGGGGYAEVFIGTRLRDNRRVAIKIMKGDFAQEHERIQNEIELLRSCKHKNIVDYEESFLYRGQVWVGISRSGISGASAIHVRLWWMGIDGWL